MFKLSLLSAFLIFLLFPVIFAFPSTSNYTIDDESHPITVLDELINYGNDYSFANSLQIQNEQNTDQITSIIHLHSVSPSFLSLLDQYDITVETNYDNMIQIVSNIDSLLVISDHPDVKYIDEPQYPVYHSITSEGVDSLHAQIAHNFGIHGEGVKIGVIDGGFDISNNEIADNVVLYESFRSNSIGRGSHGTACAEVIVDVAPKSDLYLFAIDDSTSFLKAIDRAIELDLDIISISLGWPTLRADGESKLAKKVDQARDSGMLVVISAGNSALTHSNGVFTDSNNNGLHEFNGKDEYMDMNITGYRFSVILTWDDWPASSKDLDVFLYQYVDDDLILVASSEDPQTGKHPPREVISYNRDFDDPSVKYGLVIRQNPNSELNEKLGKTNFELLFSHIKNAEYLDPSSSIYTPSDARGSLTVGAFDLKTNSLARYSSQGPTNDGRIKPDVIGPTNTSSSIYHSGFKGTSSSSPHIAGLAALLLSANPDLTSDDLYDLITQGAIQEENIVDKLGSVNNIYGHGIAITKLAIFDFDSDLSHELIRTNVPTPRIIVDDDDSEFYSLPVAFVWPYSTSHKIEIVNDHHFINNDQTRSSFTKWSDGISSTSRTFVYAPDSDISVSPVFDVQFLLSVNFFQLETNDSLISKTPKILKILPQNIEAIPGWYDRDEKVTIPTPETVYSSDTSRYLFTYWLPYETPFLENTGLTMSRPHNVTAYWQPQYALSTNLSDYRITYFHSQNNDLVLKTYKWYDSGAVAQISTDRLHYLNDQSRTYISSLTIDENSPIILDPLDLPQLSSINSPAQTIQPIYTLNKLRNNTFITPKIVMDSPHFINFDSIIQHLLIISSTGELSIEKIFNESSSIAAASDSDSALSPDINGLKVVDLMEGMTAQESGIMINEIIIKVNDIEMNNVSDLFQILDENRSKVNEITILNLERWEERTIKIGLNANEDIKSGMKIVPLSAYWNDANSILLIKAISPTDLIDNQSRLMFKNWNLPLGAESNLLDSDYFQPDDSPYLLLNMTGFASIDPLWTNQFYLELDSNLGVLQGEGWYDEGTNAKFSVFSPSIDFSSFTVSNLSQLLIRDVFESWSGDLNTNSFSESIFMDSPKIIVANWSTDYSYLLFVSLLLLSVLSLLVIRNRPIILSILQKSN